MFYEFAIFLLKYDILIIGVVLASFSSLAMYVTYKEEELYIIENKEVYPYTLDNMLLLRKLINRYYIVWYIISMLVVLGVKYFGPDKPMYLFETILCEPTYIFASFISFFNAFLPIYFRVKSSSKAIRIIYKTDE